jgi:GNAT superfamily N-acetyltransferase
VIAALIRRAVPADAAAILPLVAAINAGAEARALAPQTLARAYLDPAAAGLMLVAETPDGALVGFVTADPPFDTAWASPGLLIGDLYVAPAFRRRGVARALMAHLAAAAKARGACFLSWDVDPEDTEAMEFYRVIGATSQPVIGHDLAFAAMDALAAEAAP